MRTSFILIISLAFLSFCCNQQQSNKENEYIRNLEEKNHLLEQELERERNKPEKLVERPIEQSTTDQDYKRSENKISEIYFSIGSTEDEVLKVMGDPTSVYDIGLGIKQFMYGLSSITFKDGLVESYSNASRNLKVKYKK